VTGKLYVVAERFLQLHYMEQLAAASASRSSSPANISRVRHESRD